MCGLLIHDLMSYMSYSVAMALTDSSQKITNCIKEGAGRLSGSGKRGEGFFQIRIHRMWYWMLLNPANMVRLRYLSQNYIYFLLWRKRSLDTNFIKQETASETTHKMHWSPSLWFLTLNFLSIGPCQANWLRFMNCNVKFYQHCPATLSHLTTVP